MHGVFVQKKNTKPSEELCGSDKLISLFRTIANQNHNNSSISMNAISIGISIRNLSQIIINWDHNSWYPIVLRSHEYIIDDTCRRFNLSRSKLMIIKMKIIDKGCVFYGIGSVRVKEVLYF